MNFEDFALSVLKAKTAAEVLGPNDEGRRNREKNAKMLLHPDRYFLISHLKLATPAFARLEELLYEEKQAKASVFEVVTKKTTYTVSGLAHAGSVGNLYDCKFPKDREIQLGLLKLPRSVRDNDLIISEAKFLKTIQDSGNSARVFFPRFEEAFKHRDRATRIDRAGHVTRAVPGFVSLAEVLRAFPAGLDARDLAWIWRRMFIAITLLSDLEIVHGSVVPEHVLIRPVDHSVMVTGLTTSVSFGNTIKILGGDRKFFPPEVLNKEPVSAATDICMLCVTMGVVLRLDAPKQIRSFIKGCTFDRMKVRPQNPLILLDEFDDLLERLYGPRRFRVFPEMV